MKEEALSRAEDDGEAEKDRKKEREACSGSYSQHCCPFDDLNPSFVFMCEGDSGGVPH